MIDRNAAGAESEHGEGSSPFHQFWHHKIANWYGEEEESERECNALADFKTEQGHDGKNKCGDQRELGECIDGSQLTEEPKKGTDRDWYSKQ